MIDVKKLSGLFARTTSVTLCKFLPNVVPCSLSLPRFLFQLRQHLHRYRPTLRGARLLALMYRLKTFSALGLTR